MPPPKKILKVSKNTNEVLNWNKICEPVPKYPKVIKYFLKRWPIHFHMSLVRTCTVLVNTLTAHYLCKISMGAILDLPKIPGKNQALPQKSKDQFGHTNTVLHGL